ncbi:MAG: SapC family protein [Pseudomonadota bacterium]
MNGSRSMYRNPQVLDRKAHAELRFQPSSDFSFAADQGSFPILVNEFPEAAASYPLLFVRHEDRAPVPIASTGLGLDRNEFVDAAGRWQSDAYVPAYVRRYPFTFTDLGAARERSGDLVLCIDLDAPQLREEGVGLFDAPTDSSSVADRALEFCNRFQAGYRQTLAFAEHLDTLGLFVERRFKVTYDRAEQRDRVLQGCSVIDEERLQALDDDAFLELRRRNYLPAIYAHLRSLHRLVSLAAKLH